MLSLGLNRPACVVTGVSASLSELAETSCARSTSSSLKNSALAADGSAVADEDGALLLAALESARLRHRDCDAARVALGGLSAASNQSVFDGSIPFWWCLAHTM